MFQLSRGFRCQRAQLVSRRNGSENYIISSDGKAGFGMGERFWHHKISERRGEPSESTNLKEALCEKIPVHHDLLRNFRRHFGPSVISHITVDSLYEGLRGVKTIVRETSEIDPKHGITYRGLTIPEVIALLPRQSKSPSAESVFWLLLTGDVPTQEQTDSLINDWISRRQKCMEWWTGSRGETILSILRSLPETVTPLTRLSIALTIFDVSKQTEEAKRNGAMPYTYWEYTYEDGMEFLATLPAMIGLIAKGQMLTNVSGDGDWVEFLLQCLSNGNGSFDERATSAADFLRLYVTLNADHDGGIPAAHITHILGSTDLSINEILASGVLAYAGEPDSGTMLQCEEFQRRIRNMLGQARTKQTLKDCVLNLSNADKLIGYKEAELCDSRYTALSNYARQCLPDNSEIKLSRDITQILRSTMAKPNGKSIFPEQNVIATPIFQFYGLKDMKLNQTIFYMARVLGAIASIIWTTAVNAPVERPRSKCTRGYLKSIQDNKETKRKYRSRLLK